MMIYEHTQLPINSKLYGEKHEGKDVIMFSTGSSTALSIQFVFFLDTDKGPEKQYKFFPACDFVKFRDGFKRLPK